MKKVEYNKLIRDRIPEIIEQNGNTCKTRTLDGNAYLDALKAKLAEESAEVQEASSREALIQELADVLEVVEALQDAAHIGMEELKRVQLQKAETNGKFEKRLFLEYVVRQPE